jgi:nucleotide-binding universal stress UspA family protein
MAADFDLVVLGTLGRSALGKLFIGSVAERVTRYAPCPVLVVRSRKKD